MKKLKYLLMTLSMIVMFMGGAYFAVPSLSSNSPKDNDYVVETIAPSDGEIDDDNDDIAEYTFKTREQYFEDYEIPATLAEISKTTVTGTGSSSDPYIINSTTDFIFLTKQSLSSKYIEIRCDVITLNDETFDENGNPSGGDKKVYQWGTVSWDKCYIEGNGCEIRGLYQTNSTGKVGLFNASAVHTILNLSVSNVYLRTETLGCGGLAYIARTSIQNCHMKSGFVYTTGGHFGGLTYQLKEAINCSNNVKITTTYRGVGGISCSGSIYERCNNYATLQIVDSTASGRMGGIESERSLEGSITHCNNYGDIIAENNQQIGGIVGWRSTSKPFMIQHCANYGDVTGVLVGGIIGNIYGNGANTISNCQNYGCITAFTGHPAGGILGHANGNETFDSLKVVIKNCTSVVDKAQTAITLIGRLYCVGIIDQCSLTVNGGNPTDVFILGYGSEQACITMTNARLNVYADHNKVGLFKYGVADTVIRVENVMININCENYTKTKCVFTDSNACKDYQIDGLIFNVKAGATLIKHYYGSDFNGFNISWQTGSIGLNALDGRGQFSGTLSEEQLGNLGYEKRTI